MVISIALESRSRGMNVIEINSPSSEFSQQAGRMGRVSIFESPAERRVAEVEGEETVVDVAEEGNECSISASTTSSSIGKNSDASGRGSEEEEEEEEEEESEVQSKYKGSLDSMDALEEVLPIRRGISKFYNGKSKSFASLAEASSSSNIKEIAKPENAYTRRRRNLLAFNYVWDKNRSFPLRSNGGGISKRSISSSRSTLALAVAMSSSESISSASEDSNSSSNSKSPPHLPPLHPRSRTSHNNLLSSPLASPRQQSSPWRSFSLADLQQCDPTTTSSYDRTHH